MMSILLAVVILGVAAQGLAQQSGTCDCSLHVTVYNPLPFGSGPLHEFPARNVSEACGERDVIDCDYWCATDARDWAASTNLIDAKPEDSQSRSWGQFLCDMARSGAGVTDAITAEIEAHNRLCTADPISWIYIYDTPKILCCDQLGAHVNC